MTTSASTSPALISNYLTAISNTNKIEKHPTYEKALLMYRKAREKLLDVNAWKYDNRLKGFDYTLMNEHREKKCGLACDGDFIRFKADEDDGDYTWVLVERILEVSHDDWKSFAIRLKSIPPINQSELADKANQNNGNTNTLIIERNGNKVISYVHQRYLDAGRHENSSGLFPWIRKFFEGNQAKANTSHNNWEALIDILMEQAV